MLVIFSAGGKLDFKGGENIKELNFFCRRTFHQMAKPGGQYHPQSWSICLCLALTETIYTMSIPDCNFMWLNEIWGKFESSRCWLASGLWDNHARWGLIRDFAGLMCFAYNSCVLNAFAPSNPSLS